MREKNLNRSEALADVVENHGNGLLRAIKKRIGDPAEAEDVLQEVFAEYITSYDLGEVIESLGSWLARVARNKVLDRFRKKRSARNYLELLDEVEFALDDPHAESVRDQLRQEILDALELLPPEQREAFVLNEIEGIGFKQMSENLGVPVNTLISRKRYGVLFLREHLKEVYDELE